MRAAVILLEGGQVALIERRRDGLRYFLFPGGGVDEGESPADAARREGRGELGLVVRIAAHVATVEFAGNRQLYFLAERVSGTFGTGDGEEIGERDFEGHGSYVPVWVPLDRLAELDARPQGVVDLVTASKRAGWPSVPIEIREG